MEKVLAILNKVKESQFHYDVILVINGKREKVVFFGNNHDATISYYIESEMVLREFKHWTALYEHTFLYICKGFIAGMIAGGVCSY